MQIGYKKIPSLSEKLPLFVYSDDVLLPATTSMFDILTEQNDSLISAELKPGQTNIIGVVPSDALGSIGTAAYANKIINGPVTFHGICRFRIEKIISSNPYIIAEITQIDTDARSKEFLNDDILNSIKEVKKLVLSLYDDLMQGVIKTYFMKIPPYFLPEICMRVMQVTNEEKLQILKTIDLKERLDLLLSFLKSGKERRKITKRIIIKGSISGGGGDRINLKNEEITELEQRLKNAGLPSTIKKVIDRDLETLSKTPNYYPDYRVLFNYLTLVADLPWTKYAEETLDLHRAKHNLEIEHYGLKDVKKRILEYLAVRKLRKDSGQTGIVLCLVGPPGVGKTSIAHSIAKTLNRPITRVSLGGVNNVTDIRGHRRTYVGAMPGRIIQAVRRAGVLNPVIVLDEIDKMTVSVYGNAEAALLEVLDQAQNKDFVDTYLNVPFDISNVLFIATANSVLNLSPPLRDRLEIIEVPGYSYFEKVKIAADYLLPKQCKENGLDPDNIKFTNDILEHIINNYTFEAGVRELERKIGALCRNLAMHIAMGEADYLPFIVDQEYVLQVLGPPMYDTSKWMMRLGHPGVVAGMTWTPYGGKSTVVEVARMPGSGRLVLTGRLGKVMQESARLAWAWFRANSAMYGLDLDRDQLKEIDIHVHVPSGAINKDGPSAGVTIATALMSLFLDRPVLTNIAMTGEITLQGIVLPVGGIKEKVIAAHKDGFTKIIIPQENKKDLIDIPEAIKKDLTFVLVSDIHSVLDSAFEGGVTLINSHCVKSKL